MADVAPALALTDPFLDACPGEGSPRGCHSPSTVWSHPGDLPRDADGDADCWARLPSAPSIMQTEEGAREQRHLESSLFVDTCGGTPVLDRTVAATPWHVPERLAGMLGSPERCHVTVRVRM